MTDLFSAYAPRHSGKKCACGHTPESHIWDVPAVVFCVATACNCPGYRLARTGQTGDPRFKEILDTLWEIHQRKAKEYGSEGDSLGNITAAKEWGIPPWANSMMHAMDKIHSLKSFIETGKEPEEGMAGAFFDAANYIIIAAICWEDEKDDNPPDAKG